MGGRSRVVTPGGINIPISPPTLRSPAVVSHLKLTGAQWETSLTGKGIELGDTVPSGHISKTAPKRMRENGSGPGVREDKQNTQDSWSPSLFLFLNFRLFPVSAE